jgi:hypothetical protein
VLDKLKAGFSGPLADVADRVKAEVAKAGQYVTAAICIAAAALVVAVAALVMGMRTRAA